MVAEGAINFFPNSSRVPGDRNCSVRTFFLSPESHLSLTSPTLLSCSFCLMLASVLVASLVFVNSDCSADGDSSLDLSDILPGGGFHISEEGLLEDMFNVDELNEQMFNSYLRQMDRDFASYDTDDSENVGDVFFPDFDGELWTVDEEEEVRHLRGQTVSSPVQTISHFQRTVRSAEEKQSCTICLDELIVDINTSDFVATCGSSSYHPACLQRWIDRHSSCPNCRHHL